MNMKDLKRLGFCGLMATASLTGMTQSLEKMQWFNEPAQWEIDGNTLLMDVTPQTDYWRISHYGFTVDDAPFLYTLRGGEFEVKVKISGDYRTRFDQSGLMLSTTRITSKPESSLWMTNTTSVPLSPTIQATGASSLWTNPYRSYG